MQEFISWSFQSRTKKDLHHKSFLSLDVIDWQLGRTFQTFLPSALRKHHASLMTLLDIVGILISFYFQKASDYLLFHAVFVKAIFCRNSNQIFDSLRPSIYRKHLNYYSQYFIQAIVWRQCLKSGIFEVISTSCVQNLLLSRLHRSSRVSNSWVYVQV